MNRVCLGMPPIPFGIAVGVLVFSSLMIVANCVYGGSNPLAQALYGFAVGADVTVLALNYQVNKFGKAVAEEAMRQQAARPPSPFASMQELQQMLDNSMQGGDKQTRH